MPVGGCRPDVGAELRSHKVILRGSGRIAGEHSGVGSNENEADRDRCASNRRRSPRQRQTGAGGEGQTQAELRPPARIGNAVTPEPNPVRQAAADPSQDAVGLDGAPVASQRNAAADQTRPRRVPSKIPHLAWLEVLETGVVELDAWHRQLVNDCNRLLDFVADRAPWIQIVAAAALLTAKLMDHFRFEEEVMARNGFPRRDIHAAEHRRIESGLTELLARIKGVDGSQEEHLALPNTLKSVLIDVMVRHDLDYRSHLLYRLGR